MSNFVLYDHTGCIVYYDVSTDSLVRGSGSMASFEVVPVCYNGSVLSIKYRGDVKILGNYTLRQEQMISGIEKISIAKNNLFGASEPKSWKIIFSREHVSGWEMFRCSEIFFEDLLHDLTRSAWLSAHDRVLHTKSDVNAHENGFSISNLYYDNIENRRNIHALATHDKEIVLMRGLQTERYIRYTPLIYFSAFGSDEQRESVFNSILSLVNIGNYRGDFCIITDRNDMNYIFPENFPGKLHIMKVAVHSRIEMSKARYRIGEMFQVERYQPILYMGTDVICNDEIDPLLCNILLSQDVCIGTDDHPGVITIPSLYRESDAVGKAFFERDNFYPEADYGFNSGIIGLPDMEKGRAAFAAVSAIIENMIRLNITDGWVDQAVLNYVLRKLVCVDDKILSARIGVGTSGEVFSYRNSTREPVLIHFSSTHAPERLNRLKSYVKAKIHQLKADNKITF